uniref:Carboxypeptidase n=1 Tax=Amphora coffeiformis TaxID=265554 RepID=A0A7S3PEG2_9STRA
MMMMMMMMIEYLLVSLCLAPLAAAATTPYTRGATNDATLPECGLNCCPECDRIQHLPGYDAPLPSPWYSGYLTYELGNHTIHTHYVLVMAERMHGEDEEAAAQKPLIYWSNGGPGASSLFGLLTEVGPLWLNEESFDKNKHSSLPKPIYNPYGWTRLGHVVMIDQPAPVGFSYCEGDEKCSDISWTDELAAENSYHAMEAFYQKFPHLLETDLYLTGESYAGIYIPTLAREILKNADDYQTKSPGNVTMPLKGFAVGDGCLGTETGICGEVMAGDTAIPYWQILFLAGHAQFPLSTLQQFFRMCKPLERKTMHDPVDERCRAVVDHIYKEVGGFYAYSLYDECTYDDAFGAAAPSSGGDGLVGGGLNDYPCGTDRALQAWLKDPAVQKALHVRSEYFAVDNAVGFDYTPTEKDLTGFYKQVNGKLKVLVYNGDTDPSITSWAAQNWTSHLGLDESESWRPWTVDACRRMGGYITRYEGGFDFLTIRGAGHMVPTYKTAGTFTFLKSWLTGADYPPYVANCTLPPASVTDFHNDLADGVQTTARVD